MVKRRLLLAGLLGLICVSCSLTTLLKSGPDEQATDAAELVETLIVLTNAPTHTPSLTPTITITPSPSPTLTPSPTPTPTEDPWVISQLSSMTLYQKAGQVIMAGVSGAAVTGENCAFIQQFQPGAVVYTGGNVSTPDQLRGLSAGLQTCAADAGMAPMFLALDHEGQYVNRFSSGVTYFPAQMAIGATGDPQLAYQVAYASGQELAYSGVNMVLGPVADVLTEYDNTVISQRSFGGDPQQVALFTAQAAAGYLDAGVAPVLKHYPGHGGTVSDSHYATAQDFGTLENMQDWYFPPFEAGMAAGAPVVMTSHVIFPEIDAEQLPVTLSPVMLGYVREEQGFDGIIITDSLGMGAITGRGLSVPEGALASFKAGTDLLLVSSPGLAIQTRDRLVQAVQSDEISVQRLDESVRRILQVKAQMGLTPNPALPSVPDWQQHRELAYQVGSQAVALHRNQTGLVPIPDEVERILIIGPVDGWGLYPTLVGGLQEAGKSVNTITYSGPWNGAIPERGYLDSWPGAAAGYDLTIVLTWEAYLNQLRYGDDFQAVLVQRLQAAGVPLIVVGLKSPTDLLAFPDVPVYLATMGTTGGQIQGLRDVLLGRQEAAGRVPLPKLPE